MNIVNILKNFKDVLLYDLREVDPLNDESINETADRIIQDLINTVKENIHG